MADKTTLPALLLKNARERRDEPRENVLNEEFLEF
jgi:hypothetical protein